MAKTLSKSGRANFGCSNDRRFPDRQVIKPHVGVLRFYSPKTPKEISKWEKLLSRKCFKVTSTTKACSNHLQAGYRSKECPNSTLYVKGCGDNKRPKTRRSSKKEKRWLLVRNDVNAMLILPRWIPHQKIH